MKWLVAANSCHSSYKQNDLGWVIYGLARAYRPKVCVELGVLEGYSAIFIAAALRDNQQGHLYGYDLWEDYPHRHTTLEKTQTRIKRAGLASRISLFKCDARSLPLAFRHNRVRIDFLHIDLSNEGGTLGWAMEAFRPHLSGNGIIVFEGGSEERDQCDWMLQYDKQPIHSVLENKTMMKDWDWFVIKPYPSMTVLKPR